LKARIGGQWVDVGGPGPGVPAGGTADQVLTKVDATDFNTKWATRPVATLQRAAGGTGVTINPGTPYVPFSVNVPAVAWNRIMVITWQYYVSMAAGTSCAGALYDGVGNELSTVTTTTAFLTGTYMETMTANVGKTYSIRLAAAGAGVSVFADGHTNHINIVGVPS
jgi:hypothetical protein